MCLSFCLIFYFLFSFFHHLLLFLSSKKRLMFMFVHRKSLSRTRFPVALCITYHYSLLRSNGTAACSQRKYFGTFGVTHHSLTPHGSRGFHPHTVPGKYAWNVTTTLHSVDKLVSYYSKNNHYLPINAQGNMSCPLSTASEFDVF